MGLGPGVTPGPVSMYPLMFFDGCPKPAGVTVLLRGCQDRETLRKVKRVVAWAAYAAYYMRLESGLLADELASCTAALAPEGELGAGEGRVRGR